MMGGDIPMPEVMDLTPNKDGGVLKEVRVLILFCTCTSFNGGENSVYCIFTV